MVAVETWFHRTHTIELPDGQRGADKDQRADGHLRHDNQVARQQASFCFSSRRRHTSSDRDWSSDVCSSDLVTVTVFPVPPPVWPVQVTPLRVKVAGLEERRVGKECRSRWSTGHSKKKQT